MFFRHLEAEQNLRGMARAALRGAAMEPSDLRLWPRVKEALKKLSWMAVMCVIICVLAGLDLPQFRAVAWRDFMLAGVVMLSSRFSCGRFYWLMQSSPTSIALWHLPVAGHDICRWVRGKHLLNSLAQMPAMMAAAWAWTGFPSLGAAWMQILANGLLLWSVMLACVRLESRAHAAGVMLGKAWKATQIVWVCLLLYAWIWGSNLPPGQALPAWMLNLCRAGSWLLPAKWVMHATENATSLVLAVACLTAGGLAWWRFPETHAIFYDHIESAPTPEELRSLEVINSNSSESLVLVEKEAPELRQRVDLNPPSGQTLEGLRHAEADTVSLAKVGWIERLALALMSERDRMLAPVLAELKTNWTKPWWKALRLCTMLLVASAALMTYGTRWIDKNMVVLGTTLLPLLVMAGYTFPLSNAIPRATQRMPLGQQFVPFFTSLPITMRDLLRVSFRITVARVIACLALALPVVTAQCVILNQTKDALTEINMAVIILISWGLLRPAFIYYRLQGMSRPTHGRRLGHVCAYLLLLPLGLAALISLFIGLVLCQLRTPLSAASLLVTACCARGIYEIFHWRVRTRKVDWVTEF